MAKEEVKIIEDKKEIDKIIKEKIKGKKLVFTDYYWFGIDKKEFLMRKLKKFFHNLIKFLL